LNGGEITSSKEMVSEAAVRECMPEPIPVGTLLFSFKLSIGKMAVAGCPLYTNEAIAALPIRNPARLCRDFLRYALLAESHEATANSAVLGKVLNKEKVQQLSIPVPPLAEQVRIVKLLDEADELRRLRAQADRRTANLIPALFHEMFGDPATNSKGWPLSRIREMCQVVTGNTPPRNNAELYGSFIEWVKTDDIDSVRGIINHSTEHLSEEGAKRGRLVPAGAVIVTCIAGSLDRIGDAAISDQRVAINQQINALIPGKQVESIFLWQLTRALSKVIQNRATGVMTRIINKSTLEDIAAIQPPSTLQNEFAVSVTKIRELHAKQASSRERLDALFQSMLYRAFRGEL
jgi:type I restriction enzyme S subunit